MGASSWSRLSQAVKAGDAKALAELIKNGNLERAQLNALRDENGKGSLLGVAIAESSKNIATITVLLDAGMDINLVYTAKLPDTKSETLEVTPLVHACVMQDIPLLEFLISRGALVATKEHNAFIHASNNQHLSCIKTFCHRTELSPEMLKQGLFRGVERNSLETCEVLVTHKADVNARDVSSHTPLMKAIILDYNHDNEVLEYLVKSSDLETTDDKGYTALLIAMSRGKPKIAKRLIEAKANVGHVAEDGFTLLHFAAEKNSVEIAYLYLQTPGVDKNPQDKKDKLSPIHLSQFYNKPEVEKVLITYGCNPRLLDAGGFFPDELAKIKADLEYKFPEKKGWNPAQVEEFHKKHKEGKRDNWLEDMQNQQHAAGGGTETKGEVVDDDGKGKRDGETIMGNVGAVKQMQGMMKIDREFS